MRALDFTNNGEVLCVLCGSSCILVYQSAILWNGGATLAASHKLISNEISLFANKYDSAITFLTVGTAHLKYWRRLAGSTAMEGRSVMYKAPDGALRALRHTTLCAAFVSRLQFIVGSAQGSLFSCSIDPVVAKARVHSPERRSTNVDVAER